MFYRDIQGLGLRCLKLGVQFWGPTPLIRNMIFLGLYWGPPILGNYQIAECNTMPPVPSSQPQQYSNTTAAATAALPFPSTPTCCCYSAVPLLLLLLLLLLVLLLLLLLLILLLLPLPLQLLRLVSLYHVEKKRVRIPMGPGRPNRKTMSPPYTEAQTHEPFDPETETLEPEP